MTRTDEIALLVEYADLPIIDFSKLATSGGSAELAKEVHDAMTTSGFLYVINHGHTQAQVHELVIRDITASYPHSCIDGSYVRHRRCSIQPSL